MSFDQIYAIGFASIALVVVFGGLYRFKRFLRKRLFPTEGMSGRENAMAELLLPAGKAGRESESGKGMRVGGKG